MAGTPCKTANTRTAKNKWRIWSCHDTTDTTHKTANTHKTAGNYAAGFFWVRMVQTPWGISHGTKTHNAWDGKWYGYGLHPRHAKTVTTATHARNNTLGDTPNTYTCA